MTSRSPEDMKKWAAGYAARLKEATRRSVKVGLPTEKVGGEIYDDGQTVIEVGAQHEFGSGHIPQRSFLRAPFSIKNKELTEGIEKQFNLVKEGLSVKTALGRIGAIATNISKEAFVTRGYGEWPELSQRTIDEKGSSQILIDTGTLRRSVTWVVE